jgi:hypothetical protein
MKSTTLKETFTTIYGKTSQYYNVSSLSELAGTEDIVRTLMGKQTAPLTINTHENILIVSSLTKS